MTATVMRAGDDWAQTYTFKDKATQQPLNLVTAGWTNWRAQWRSDSGQVIPLTIVTTLANTGIINAYLSGDQIASMGTRGVFALKATRGGKDRTFLEVKTVWKPEVTE